MKNSGHRYLFDANAVGLYCRFAAFHFDRLENTGATELSPSKENPIKSVYLKPGFTNWG
jgi:hypothetical protein